MRPADLVKAQGGAGMGNEYGEVIEYQETSWGCLSSPGMLQAQSQDLTFQPFAKPRTGKPIVSRSSSVFSPSRQSHRKPFIS